MPDIRATVQKTNSSARIVVSAYVGLPLYAVEPAVVDFVVDTGAETSVLAFRDWTRIVTPSLQATLSANAGARSAGGTVRGATTEAVLRFLAIDGEEHHCALDNLFLLLEPGAGLPSLLGMDVMLRGGMTFDYPSGHAVLSLG